MGLQRHLHVGKDAGNGSKRLLEAVAKASAACATSGASASSSDVLVITTLRTPFTKVVCPPRPAFRSGIWAAPSERDILKWEFVLCGSEDTPYEGGLYHGRLVFPPSFPMAPPAIQMVTPSGRFEVPSLRPA